MLHLLFLCIHVWCHVKTSRLQINPSALFFTPTSSSHNVKLKYHMNSNFISPRFEILLNNIVFDKTGHMLNCLHSWKHMSFFKGTLTRCHALFLININKMYFFDLIFTSHRTVNNPPLGDLFKWKSLDRRVRCTLIRVVTAAVGAVAALSRVQKSVNVGIQLGYPVARHQECCQVEKIHKNFVSVTN